MQLSDATGLYGPDARLLRHRAVTRKPHGGKVEKV
jgi:hypothetical protein